MSFVIGRWAQLPTISQPDPALGRAEESVSSQPAVNPILQVSLFSTMTVACEVVLFLNAVPAKTRKFAGESSNVSLFLLTFRLVFWQKEAKQGYQNLTLPSLSTILCGRVCS